MLGKEGKRTAVRATKNPAPALIPKSPESAKGFLVTPCMTPPERAKAAPVKHAASALGIRITSIILPRSVKYAGRKIASAKTCIFPPATPMLTENRRENSRIHTIRTMESAKPACVRSHCRGMRGEEAVACGLLDIALVYNGICQFLYIQQLAIRGVRHIILRLILTVIYVSVFYRL